MALAIWSRGRRLNAAIDRALAVPADAAAFRTAVVGRRHHSSAPAGPEGPQGSRPTPEVPTDWTAPYVDISHIDADRHLPRRIGHAASQARLLIPDPGLARAPFTHAISATLVHTYSQ